MMTVRVRFFVLTIAAAIGARPATDSGAQQIAGQQQAGLRGTVRDSSGVTIVTHDRVASARQLALGSPLVTVGTRTGEEFTRVLDAFRLANGTIVVGDSRTNQLL